MSHEGEAARAVVIVTDGTGGTGAALAWLQLNEAFVGAGVHIIALNEAAPFNLAAWDALRSELLGSLDRERDGLLRRLTRDTLSPPVARINDRDRTQATWHDIRDNSQRQQNLARQRMKQYRGRR